MQSIDLIRDNPMKSRSRVLARVEDMREHCLVFPTPRGGAHTLWVVGHLAYTEALVIRWLMIGRRTLRSPAKVGHYVLHGIGNRSSLQYAADIGMCTAAFGRCAAIRWGGTDVVVGLRARVQNQLRNLAQSRRLS